LTCGQNMLQWAGVENMIRNLTVTIRARIKPELNAAIQARAMELHLKKSDLIRLALAAAVQNKGLSEMLDRVRVKTCQKK